MDWKTKTTIASIAWDCTVGAGIDPDRADKPTSDDLKYFTRELGREPTAEELKVFNAKWSEGVRSIAQP